MNILGLTEEEISQLLVASQRFLINESTHPHDVQLVLMERLRDRQPNLAAKIGRMDQGQMASLCRTVLTQRHLYR
jgi:hypothetical protein